MTTPYVDAYTSGPISETNAYFPVAFLELPSITASLTPVGFTGVLQPCSGLSLESTGMYQIIRPDASENCTYRICYHVVGIWKKGLENE